MLRPAMVRRVGRRIHGSGVINLPSAPSLCDHYVSELGRAFEIYGRPFTESELAKLREILLAKLQEGWTRSPFSEVEVSYHTEKPPNDGLTYHMKVVDVSMADRYENWVATRTPPLFGKHGDGRALTVARSLENPGEHAALDIGAGTGRNAFALAEIGLKVDALEPVPGLAASMKKDASERKSSLNVIEGNLFDTGLPLKEAGYSLVLLSEVIASHCRGVPELERILTRASELTRPGGVLLFNMFLTMDGYKPDAMAKELSEVFWSVAFTRRELSSVIEKLPLDLIRDESAHDTEKAICPPADWPPTGWFVEWSLGRDVFDVPVGKVPLELRWIECRKRASG